MTPTPAEQAAAIIDKVRGELAPIWLGGRQRMILEREITAALTEAHEAGRQAGKEGG